jgi:hypothetical protein
MLPHIADVYLDVFGEYETWKCRSKWRSNSLTPHLAYLKIFATPLLIRGIIFLCDFENGILSCRCFPLSPRDEFEEANDLLQNSPFRYPEGKGFRFGLSTIKRFSSAYQEIERK